jgi:hypothetical protein
MQKFTAAVFFKIGTYLAYAKSGASPLSRDIKINPVLDMVEDEKGKIILAIRSQCQEIGLMVSIRCIDSIVDGLTTGRITVGEYVDSIGQLENIISWEMQDRLFMFIPPDRAAFYAKNDLFGPDVNVKFPDIQFDVIEAGNTYASGRGTACVFHLMRIMEFGVQKFGSVLGVTLASEKNWQPILEEIDKKIKALPQKAERTIQLADVSTMLYHVKIAWRNPTMHPKQIYTLEEAENILLAMKTFMQHLSTVV